MGTADIAIACCRAAGDASAEDLYPDPDAAPLSAAFRELGANARTVSWDDPAVEWSSFDRVVVSSTWDSVDRPFEYLAWTRRVSALTTLVNPSRLIEWGIDKAHQRELALEGVPVVPTAWVEPSDGWQPPASEYVVKPSISAGGRNTARYRGGVDERAAAHVRMLQIAGQTVMVQPYLPAVDTEGETDLVFFDGEFSHAVRKDPLLQRGEGVVEGLWERLEWSGSVTPTHDQLTISRHVMAYLADRFGQAPTYGRVDFVPGLDGGALVIEVEVIDPYLSLDVVPDGAARLARAALSASR